MADLETFLTAGWVHFPRDPAIAKWAAAALPLAQSAARSPLNQGWMDCEGTWFIGVDALKNASDGRLPDGTSLEGAPITFVKTHLGCLPALHLAQTSITYPGYPRPRKGESDAAFRYRERRDAAHVDGVKMIDAGRNRRVEEPHAWVLGIPLNDAAPTAAPLVVWEGSHEVMRKGFAKAFEGVPVQDWAQVDVTEAYKAARAEAFETCRRVAVHARPGESYLMHRLCLHGVAPWAAGDQTEGRAIAYFRPEMPGGLRDWLTAP